MIDAPYKGLTPYTEADADYFFGRDPEREIIAANLLAARLTLLYGASGVGKSSVLNAGVAYDLRRASDRIAEEMGHREYVVVTFSAWRDRPLAHLLEAIRGALQSALAGQGEAVPTPSGAFANALMSWTGQFDIDICLILDQFEEYCLYHPHEDGAGTIAGELPPVLTDAEQRVNVLISIREDALARLDRFKGRIPRLFDNYLRIDHLDREAARDAIAKPIDRFNRDRPAAEPPVRIEPALVADILDELQAGRLFLGVTGEGVVGGAAGGAMRIETPYLQLVMTRLWNEERTGGSAVLRLETLRALGGARRIVRTHLDSVMATLSAGERAVAEQVFRFLVTPSGTKIAHIPGDLAAYTGLREDRVTAVLERLCATDARVLRTVAPPISEPGATRYEIFHDVLAAAIADWRERYLRAEAAASAAAAERQRMNRLLRRLWPVAIGLAATFLMILYLFLDFRLNQLSEPVYVRINDLPGDYRFRPVAPAADPVAPAEPSGPSSGMRSASGLERIQRLLADDIAAGKVVLVAHPGSIRIILSGPELFESGRDQIGKAYLPTLDRIAEAIADVQGPIRVIGHTDNLPVRTLRFPSNWHLAESRAQAVVRRLAEGTGDATRLVAEGRGDSEPLVPNTSAEGRARNRRIEIDLGSAAVSGNGAPEG
jgi:type VI secretion system peptidoglycan-associated protein